MASELRGRNLLYLASKTFVCSEEDILTCTWKALKEVHGVSSILMVISPSEPNVHWCSRLQESGCIDDFEATSILDYRGGDDILDIQEVAGRIVRWVKSKGIKLDGCICPTDRLLQLKAEVCEQLNIPTDGTGAVEAAVLKDVTQERVLNDQRAKKYGVKSFSVDCDDEVVDACNNLPFPIIMKPLSGMGSHGVRSLSSAEEAKCFFKLLQPDIARGGDLTAKLHSSDKVVMMERLFGNQYAVDVVICRGELVGGVVIQRGRPTLPSCYATALSMPGDTTSQQRQELVDAAYLCCMAVGLRNGVYDVDLMWEENNFPKLIEINPRCGGYSILRCAKAIYNVDLFLFDIMLACGLTITASDTPIEPRGHVVGHLAFLHRDQIPLQRCWQDIYKYTSDENFIINDLISMGTGTALEINAPIRVPCCVFLYFNEDHDHALSKLAEHLAKVTFLSNEKDLLKLFEPFSRY